MRNFSASCAVLALAALTACASGQSVEGVQSGSACTGCHGGKDNQTGAPPFDAHNSSTSAAVGAHTTHVNPAGANVACAACHANTVSGPAGAPVLVAGGPHANGTANVDFGSLADPTHVATYDRTTHTCSNVYCHAPPSAPGGSTPAPAWTGTITGCGACHAAPAAIHGGGLVQTQCVLCHATTVDPAGALKAGGTHANGTVDHFQHDPGWIATSAKGVTPHGMAATYQNKAAFPTGLEGCRTCHGSNLDNPIASTVPSCDSCHQPYSLPGTSGADWRTDCTFCHGDRARASLQEAPPRDVQGNTLQAASASIGAHQAHLFGIAGTPRISNGVTCSDCHGGTSRTLPTSFEPHVNGTTEVTLKQPGQNAATGTFSPSTLTCSSTYCHGNLPRNPKSPPNNPVWTDSGTQANCGSCHATNGTYCGTTAACAGDVTTGTVGVHGPRHEAHRCARCHGNSATSAFSNQVGCFACHGGYQRQLGTSPSPLTPPVVNLNYHVDGAVEVIPTTTPISPRGTPITITITYTAPSGGNPASCSTNCHTLGAHGVTNPQTW